MYYHTREDSRYIAELKDALVETGIYEDDTNWTPQRLTLKPQFRQSSVYRKGYLAVNSKRAKSANDLRTLNNLIPSVNIRPYTVSSGQGTTSNAMSDENNPLLTIEKMSIRHIKLKDIPSHITRYAMTKNPFYYYAHLVKYFPDMRSIRQFITSESYLGGLTIPITGPENRLEDISNDEFLAAVSQLLSQLEIAIKNRHTEEEGSEFFPVPIRKIFIEKEVKVYQHNKPSEEMRRLAIDAPWYGYSTYYGTPEDDAFLQCFANIADDFNKYCNALWLIRNMGLFTIYDGSGRAFRPRFILFCQPANRRGVTLQIVIQLQNPHTPVDDNWKVDFLRTLQRSKTAITTGVETVLLTGLYFKTQVTENQITDTLKRLIVDESEYIG